MGEAGPGCCGRESGTRNSAALAAHKQGSAGTFLVAQWLRLCPSNAGWRPLTPQSGSLYFKNGEIELISSVQPPSHVRLFATPWTAACQASLSITNSQSWLKLMSIESAMPSNHSILCRPLLLLLILGHL